jgi:hypothetical protein
MALPPTISSANEYIYIVAEFPYDLTAYAAWEYIFLGITNNGHGAKTTISLGYSFKYSRPLSAIRRTICSVLYIAAGIYAAGLRQQCRTYAKMRIRRISALTRLFGLRYKHVHEKLPQGARYFSSERNAVFLLSVKYLIFVSVVSL